MTALDATLRFVSGAMWASILLFLMLPPLLRLVRRQGRYLDALWSVMLLGVINRLMFVGGADRTIAYLAAILMEGLLAAVVWSYQRDDR